MSRPTRQSKNEKHSEECKREKKAEAEAEVKREHTVENDINEGKSDELMGKEEEEQERVHKKETRTSIASAVASPGSNAQQLTGRSEPTNLVGVDLGVPDGTEVIDWAAAVDQCSGDVSFLEELLVDLWNESNAHMQQLKEFVPRALMLDTQHEAHSIKGAAANLMCHRLRLAALYMERAGQVGTRLKEGSEEFNSVKGDLDRGMEVLERELALFKVMLKQKKLV